MKTNVTFFLLTAASIIFSFENSIAQTWNIPAASATNTGYLGTATGDLILKSPVYPATNNIYLQAGATAGSSVATAGNSIILNTNGSATAPNLKINSTGQIGIGVDPKANAAGGGGYYTIFPKIQIQGPTNSAVPAFSPIDIVNIAPTGTTVASNSLGLTYINNMGVLRSPGILLNTSTVTLSSNIPSMGTGLCTVSIGSPYNQLTNVTGGINALENPLYIGNTGALPVAGSTTMPAGYNLYVKQGILTEKLKVAVAGQANWSDFVFDKNYKLKSLSEVELFIQKNKHLPDVPSADEVVKDGIDVANMDAKLLQKIEELTLYMIEMKKENETLKTRVQSLENK